MVAAPIFFAQLFDAVAEQRYSSENFGRNIVLDVAGPGVSFVGDMGKMISELSKGNTMKALQLSRLLHSIPGSAIYNLYLGAFFEGWNNIVKRYTGDE